MKNEKKSLLLVDDDAVIRDILRSAFESDYQVIEASDCAGTVKVLKRSIDIAIIDYVLPDRDGLHVLRLLREVNPTLPVIIMTGHRDENVIIRALRAHVADYVKKPVSLAYLRQRLSEIFEDEDTAERTGSAKARDHTLESIAAHIEEQYMKDLNLDDLARMACMNRFTFSRMFKKKFGRTFISYLNSVRIKNAIILMKNQNYRIADIAYNAGYKYVEHFSRVFKAVYKVSPKEYRHKLISSQNQRISGKNTSGRGIT